LGLKTSAGSVAQTDTAREYSCIEATPMEGPIRSPTEAFVSTAWIKAR
jgi:hypothetical protein